MLLLATLVADKILALGLVLLMCVAETRLTLVVPTVDIKLTFSYTEVVLTFVGLGLMQGLTRLLCLQLSLGSSMIVVLLLSLTA